MLVSKVKFYPDFSGLFLPIKMSGGYVHYKSCIMHTLCFWLLLDFLYIKCGISFMKICRLWNIPIGHVFAAVCAAWGGYYLRTFCNRNWHNFESSTGYNNSFFISKQLSWNEVLRSTIYQFFITCLDIEHSNLESHKLAGSFGHFKVNKKFINFVKSFSTKTYYPHPDLWDINSLFKDFLYENCNIQIHGSQIVGDSYTAFKDSWMTIVTTLFHDLQKLQDTVNYT
jgi:hypothetical protein